ncbi:MAG TPA: DUF2382 domain-containing protein [Candidatus Tectomicrobia bacterium]|nr:DUF2382 domain-containing protein [Candidatus Tectomicrobia bacterium]
MAKIVIGFFEQVSEAQRVLQDLLDHGFDRDQISLIAHRERSGLEAGGTWRPRVISVPGIGPVLATGPLAANLSSTTGDPSGASLLDVLRDSGVPADEAEWYLDAVRRGGTLVAVDTGDADADGAVDIMNRAMQPAPAAGRRGKAAAETSRKGEDIETIERSIDLSVPVQSAYQRWTRFEDFPRFMEGVEQVRRLDAKRLHWVANIGGTRKEWDAQITENVPNERIAWRSEAGEFTAGVVTFQPLGPDRTRMTVRFEYEPQGVKETLGDWLGLVSRRVEGDLERFKAFVEANGQEPVGQRATAPTAGRTRSRTTSAAATAAAADRRFEDYEPDFQRHYRTAWAGREQPYAHGVPAYRYGYALATDPRYAGRDWPTIEAEARREWEARHQGSWEEFKDAVHYAWEHVRGRHHADEGDVHIPVIEEKLQVGTREVERGGVRVYSHITEQPVEQEVRLRDERVNVERRPVDRPATERDFAAFKEGTIEMTETHEEPVVAKEARVVEEVVIGKDVRERTERVRDTVRRTEVDVESMGKESTLRAGDFSAYEHEFRSHYNTAFAQRGSPYDRWAPAYRYGYEMATDLRYRDRDWTTIETDARREWEQRHRGTWEEFKEAIRYGWDKVRGRR